ncbi:hypothetical protein QTP88_022485 [Uroleucon formosanum]
MIGTILYCKSRNPNKLFMACETHTYNTLAVRIYSMEKIKILRRLIGEMELTTHCAGHQNSMIDIIQGAKDSTGA